MLVVLLVIAHLLACAWHGLVVLQQDAALGPTEQADGVKDVLGNTQIVRHWVNSNGLREATTKKKYMVAMYWAFQTMTTVGYGDVGVSNNTEKIFTIFVMIIGGICFGYIIGSVTSMLENLNMVVTLRDQKLDGVKDYVFDRHFPVVISVKMKQHFRYIYGKLGVFFDETDICDDLPAAVRVDLLREQRRHLVVASSLFSRDGASESFVASIIASMIPCKLEDGEFLFFESEVATHAFFVESGTVKLLALSNVDRFDGSGDSRTHNKANAFELRTSENASEDRKMKPEVHGGNCGIYSTGRIVGAEGLLLTYRHVYSAVCCTMTQVFTIPKEDLIEAFEVHAPLVRLWLEREATVIVNLANSQKATIRLNREVPSTTWPVWEAQGLSATPEVTRDDDRIEGSCSEEEHDVTNIFSLREQLTKLTRRLKFVLRPQKSLSFPGCDVSISVKREKFDGNASPADLWAGYGLFHPELGMKVAWDSFVSALIVLSILGNAYIFAFGLSAQQLCSVGALRDPWLVIFIFIDATFLIDVLATCNTAVLSESRVPRALISSRSTSVTVRAPTSTWPTYTIATSFLCCLPLRPECGLFHIQIDGRSNSLKDDRHRTCTSYSSAVVVTSRWQIVMYYASSGWLVVDLLSSVPIDTFAGCGKNRSKRSTFLSLFKMLRVLRLAKIQQKSKKLRVFADKFEDFAGVNPAWFKLMKPLFVMFVIAHALTCLFFYAGRKRNQSKAWLDAVADDDVAFRGTLRDDDKPTQYVSAIYWSFATMTTVGYGDHSPSFDNAPGLAVGIVSNVVGTMIFAYVIGMLVSLVTNLHPSARLHRSEKAYLRHYLFELRRAPDYLLIRVSRAQTHVLSVNGVFDDISALVKLPHYMRYSCLLFVYRDFLLSAPFLGSLEREHSGCLMLLLPHLQPAKYLLAQPANSPQINAREVNFVHIGFCKMLKKQCHGPLYHPGLRQSGGGCDLRRCIDAAAQCETYGPLSLFGQATVCIPTDQPFKLRCRVVCDSAYCQVFLLKKRSLDDLRHHYESLVKDIESRLYNASLVQQWTSLVDLPRG